MKITLHVDVPKEDLERYLRAANAVCGNPSAEFRPDIDGFVDSSKRTTSYQHERYMGILIDRAISYLKCKEQFGD